MSLYKALLIPDTIPFEISSSAWLSLNNDFDLSTIDLPSNAFLLSNKSRERLSLNGFKCIAQRHKDNYDLIIGSSTSAFLWHWVFRRIGDVTPFALIPHFNHIELHSSFFLLLSSLVLRCQDVLFSGSPSSGKIFDAYGFNTHPYYPFGIKEDYKPIPESKFILRDKYAIPRDKKILIYTGRLEPDKNIHGLLLSFNQIKTIIPSMLLIVYIDADNQIYFDDCFELASLIQDVRFVKSPQQHEMVELYNLSDLFISLATSPYETFGRSPLEAAACGIPCILPKYNGFRDNFINTNHRLVDVRLANSKIEIDIDEFSQKAIAFLENLPNVDWISHGNFRQSKIVLSRFQRDVSTALGYTSEKNYEFKKSLAEYPNEIKSLWRNLPLDNIDSLLDAYLAEGSQALVKYVSTRDYEGFRTSMLAKLL